MLNGMDTSANASGTRGPLPSGAYSAVAKAQQPTRLLGGLRDADLQLNLENMRSHPLEDPYAVRSNIHAVAAEPFLEPQLIHDGESSAMARHSAWRRRGLSASPISVAAPHQ